MKQKITLTAGELYYLGTVLQAKYIDYAYVAALEDISKNYAVYESDVRNALVRAGILAEDLSGALEVNEEVHRLLDPVFFGEFEGCVDIAAAGEDAAAVCTSRFHSSGGVTVMVHSTEEGKLALEEIGEEELLQIVTALLPADYRCTVSAETETLPQDAVTRIISVKNTHIGRSAEVRLFVEADGILYSEKTPETVQSLTAEMFVQDVLRLLKEVS